MYLKIVLFSCMITIQFSSVFPRELVNFLRIRKAPDFVDKTMLIKEFVDNGQSLVVAAPRGFGKSTNLEMIRCFLSNTVERSHAEELFQSTQVSRYEKFMKTHLGNYPVILCSFKPDHPVSNYEELLTAFRFMLYRTFQEHKYLAKSPHVKVSNLEEMKIYLDDVKHTQITPTQIAVGLYFLSQMLHSHYGKKVIVLIDDYDNILLDSILNKSLNITAVLDVFNSILTGALFHNEHVKLSMLIGTTCALMKPLTNLELSCVRSLEFPFFEPHFGLTESEVDDLLKRVAFKSLEDRKQDITMWYDGYTGPDLTGHMYNTRSTLCFLRYNNLRSYWNDTMSTHAFNILLDESATKRLLKESAEKMAIVVRDLPEVDAAHMQGLKDMLLTGVWREEYADLYIHLLMEQGYLTYEAPWHKTQHNTTTSVKFPNLEVCEAVQYIIKNLSDDAKKKQASRIVT